MRPADALTTALRALAASPARSALTALGVSVGAAAVVLVAVLGYATRLVLDDQLDRVGKTLVLARPTEDGLKFTSEEVAALRRHSGLARSSSGPAAASLSPQLLEYRGRRHATTVSQVDPEAFHIRHWRLAAGRFLTRQDGRSCVLGYTVALALALSPSPLTLMDRDVLIGGVTHKVVGVLAPRGRDPLGRDHDDEAFLPPTQGPYDVIIIAANTSDDVDQTVAWTRQVLRACRHRQIDDFEVTSVAEMAQIGVFGAMTLNALTTCLAAVALLVGGVGVMATALASAAEKTRETGVRLAVGASPMDVFLPLLLESVLLTGLGGLLGAFLGVLGAGQACAWLGWPFGLPPYLLAITPALLVTAGVLAGVYPAWKASRSAVIDALRVD